MIFTPTRPKTGRLVEGKPESGQRSTQPKTFDQTTPSMESGEWEMENGEWKMENEILRRPAPAREFSIDMCEIGGRRRKIKKVVARNVHQCGRLQKK